MATKIQLEALQLYANLMEEVKIRLSAIESAVNGGTPFVGPLVREFSFMQLRMICELIALGCLTAHGDLKVTSRLQKEHAVDKIFEHLERLHPHFYPTPVTQTVDNPSRHPIKRTFTLIARESGFLTKKELLTLHAKCGDVLHRGSLKKLLKPQMPIVRNFEEIGVWANKVGHLLNHHIFSLIDGNTVVVCNLRNRDNNNKVQVAIGEGVERPAP